VRLIISLIVADAYGVEFSAKIALAP
jgi:hypothetical protein